MSSFFKKKPVIAAIAVTACVAVVAGVGAITGTDIIGGAVKTVFSPIQSGFSFIGNKISGFQTFLWEMKGYKEENTRLVEQVNELTKNNKDTEQYRLENERLKELLELEQSMDGYSTVAARVISYAPNNWYDTVEINKGSNSGIAVGNAVVTTSGLVGRVTKVGPNWSTIDTILNKDTAIGVSVTRTDKVAVVEGDTILGAKKFCKLSFIDSEANIIVGDLLETSGMGGAYPSGYRVGTVREIDADNMGTVNSATVEPAVDFSNLYEVIVINGVN